MCGHVWNLLGQYFQIVPKMLKQKLFTFKCLETIITDVYTE